MTRPLAGRPIAWAIKLVTPRADTHEDERHATPALDDDAEVYVATDG